jgi:acyl-coenzyme A thioesterase PaaI-like protein
MENDFGLKAPFYNLEDGTVATVVTFKKLHQSYPDRTHGGMVSTLLDEIMGRALWIYEPETFGVATTLSVTFRKPVPLETPVKARGYLTFNSARGCSAIGEVFDMDGNLLVQASAKYFKIPFSRVFGENTTVHEQICYEIPVDLENIDFPPKTK